METTTSILDCSRCGLNMTLVWIDQWHYQCRAFCVACQRGNVVVVRQDGSALSMKDAGNAVAVTVNDRNDDGNIVGTTTVFLPDDTEPLAPHVVARAD